MEKCEKKYKKCRNFVIWIYCNIWKNVIKLEPLSNTMYDVMLENFKEYMITGGMPAIVSNFIKSKNFSGILKMQQQILLDY